MISKQSLPEFNFLDNIIHGNIDATSLGTVTQLEASIQDNLLALRNNLIREDPKLLALNRGLREKELKGYFKYLESIDAGDPSLMGPMDLFHLKAVHNLTWGYLVVCIIAYKEARQGLFMQDFVTSLSGTLKIDNLFYMARSYGITDEKTLIKEIKPDLPVDRVLEKLRNKGLINSENKMIKPVMVVSAACKQYAGDEGIQNWAQVFAPIFGKTRSNLTSSAKKAFETNSDIISEALKSLSLMMH